MRGPRSDPFALRSLPAECGCSFGAELLFNRRRVVYLRSVLRAHLRIDEIRCERCARSIAETLGAAGGITRAEVSLADRQAEIEYDETRIDEKTIVAILREDGYDAAAASSPRR